MSGKGSPQLTLTDCHDLRVGVVASLWSRRSSPKPIRIREAEPDGRCLPWST